ncbi:hypothetical protein DEI83_11730 [Curtobacterium sp. MCBD17_021]|nr:hypothetical protein DEI83_11730 [Curtobacterium sp. MCBD17_021]
MTTALTMSGCSGNATDPSEAKETIVDLVEESARAVGGAWTLYRGPAAEVCEQPGGGEGAHFVFILEREGADGPAPAADIRTVESLWRSKGITTERFQSGSSEPLTGVNGVGGPVTTVGFDAYPQGYAITGVSKCSDGDVQELRRRG